MKKIILLGIIIMFFFKNFAMANYEKIFFDHSIKSIDDKIINLNEYTNKAVLLVNVASYCGFTKQYDDLQKLWDKYKDKGLIVLGVPSNSFNQEKDKNDEVKKFCEVNFGINFPMTSILEVKGDNAHEIYKWAKRNHGKSAVPKWNFHKILIDKNGKIFDTYASFTKPMSKKIINAVEKILN
tara:strand:+ start:1744 stop:2289 length:546 start_codon:yes stop_codon:yes gene_type:complete